jgi:hypothetical protein
MLAKEIKWFPKKYNARKWNKMLTKEIKCSKMRKNAQKWEKSPTNEKNKKTTTSKNHRTKYGGKK